MLGSGSAVAKAILLQTAITFTGKRYSSAFWNKTDPTRRSSFYR